MKEFVPWTATSGVNGSRTILTKQVISRTKANVLNFFHQHGIHFLLSVCSKMTSYTLKPRYNTDFEVLKTLTAMHVLTRTL